MKAILVFNNMPANCDKCEVRCDGYTGKQYAEKGITRPSWCPLRPLPEAKPETTMWGEPDEEAHGYNLCLDEILGEIND